jgi:TorA maturation chaperone TorD
MRPVELESATAEQMAALGQALLRPPPGASEDLVIEHNRLFLNPLGAPCAPWQSLYSDEPRLMGEAHHDALAWFRRFGWEPATATEPADHAGLLLVFAAYLMESGVADGEREEFRRRHLAWIGPWAEEGVLKARHPFYISVFQDLAKLCGGRPEA